VVLDPDGGSAYVVFAQADMASFAARRLSERVNLFGSPSSDPPQVDLVCEIPDHVRLATVMPTTSAAVHEEPMDPSQLPEHLRPRKEKKKRSRSRRKRRSRSRRRRSRSAVRWLDRSRSNSHTATGQYIRAVGCSSTVRWWEKKNNEQARSSSSSSSRSQRRQKVEEEANKRPRQVAVKGQWAQFVHHGLSYYYNIATGRTAWDRPGEFDDRRASEEPKRPTSCYL